MDITIAVAMHKPYRTSKDPMYLPIHVGATLNPDVLPDMTGDNTGDNISQLNPYFCELTALYWMWKNCDSDYKGLVHYRRYFATRNPLKWLSRNRFERVMGLKEMQRLLRRHNILLPWRRRYFIETIYSHYDHTLYAEQLHVTRKVLQTTAPEYVVAWDAVMRQRDAHLFNMMVMDKADFDAYCAWLFPILFKVAEQLDPQQYSPFHARYPGRVSEILLNVWIRANHRTYKDIPTTYMERIDWKNKITGFLKAKFKKTKYTRSF